MSRVPAVGVRTVVKDAAVKPVNSKLYAPLPREPLLDAAAKKSLLRADLPSNDRSLAMDVFLRIGREPAPAKAVLNR